MHFPLNQWKPADIARLIVLLPVEHVPKKKGWRKREMRIRPSHRSAPMVTDLKTLNKATKNQFWKAYFEDEAEEFPRVGLMHGPLMEDGGFLSPQRVHNALTAFREREPFQGLYSRLEHDYDVEKLEYARALARENFILGQRGEGPYIDGLVYKRVDSLLEAEIAYCDARLRFTSFILSQRRKEKVTKKQQESEKWVKLPEGTEEKVAKAYEHSGFKIRKIETTSKRWYEVLQQ